MYMQCNFNFLELIDVISANQHAENFACMSLENLPIWFFFVKISKPANFLFSS